MRIYLYILFLSLSIGGGGCKSKKAEREVLKFDKVKWAIKEDEAYPYRDKMLKDFIDNYKIKGIKHNEIIALLGQPNRTESGHLYYSISKNYLGNFPVPINTKTLVVKLSKDSTVEWRKIHQ